MKAEHSDFAASAGKAGLAWVGVGVGSSSIDWAVVASQLAAVYTILLILEWIWKKLWKAFIRPLAVKRGWVKPLVTESSKNDPYGL